MGLARDLLLDKKIFEAVEEIDQFFEDKGVEPGSIVQSITFDKVEFNSTENVNDFLNSHWMSGHDIDEEKKKFSVDLIDPIGFISSTLKTIELRAGVQITLGLLRPMSPDNPVLFQADDNVIQLNENLPVAIEIATTVDGFHPAFGNVSITKADLVSFKNNFENKVVGIDLSIDFDHEIREAAGWITELFLSQDEETLLAVVRWTPEGARSLSDKEFRYYSPEFSHNWVHPHTGTSHGPTLLGGALVNRPFLKMDAIVGLSEKNKGANMEQTIKLADHNAKIVKLQGEISDLRLSESTAKNAITNMKEENVKLSDEVKGLKEAADKKDREDKLNVLFSENKINAAQLEALKEGKEFMDVLSLGAQMNGTAQGDGNADNKTIVQLSDKELAMCKALDLTPEEYIQANKEA